MKITVNSHTVFLFPTKLAFNRITAGIISRKLRKKGVNLTYKQTAFFIKEIARYKKDHSDWNIVEIKEEKGDTIVIRI